MNPYRVLAHLVHMVSETINWVSVQEDLEIMEKILVLTNFSAGKRVQYHFLEIFVM